MKLFEVTNPKMTPELIEYLTSLHLLHKTTISPSGKLIVDGDVTLLHTTTSIRFSFESVGGDFNCASTNITSLEHAPQTVGGGFFCNNTKITSLAGAPQSVGGDFNCALTDITSLEGAPQTVGGSVNCTNTKITSLKGIHKTHRNWKIGGVLYLPPACADIVGLTLIEGIKHIRIGNHEFDISDHDPHSFQEKLIDAGLRAQARM